MCCGDQLRPPPLHDTRAVPSIRPKALLEGIRCASNGRFWPTSFPLFQGRRFGLTAGSWVLDIRLPRSIPPAPGVDTVLTYQFYQLARVTGSGARSQYDNAAPPHGRLERVLPA